MTLTITLTNNDLDRLDLTPVQAVIAPYIEKGNIADYGQQLRLNIEYSRTADDPRELPEIPEVRLWFLRLDAYYPWLPFLLDWQAGELVRYAAMLVPHEFNVREGIQYNPQALELFVMSKIFVMSDWLRQQGLERPAQLKSMAQLFGYDLEDDFFALL